MYLPMILTGLTFVGCQDSPVGIADSSIIPDDRFTASSYYDSRYAPKYARLNGAGNGWGPKTSNVNEYLQIDLGQVFVICAVATQGNNNAEWTTQYKILISLDSSIWTTYKDGNTDKLFTGNTDMNTVVKNVLDVPVLVRFLKFIPTTYTSWKVLRVEAYGFKKDLPCRSLPVGVGNGKIPDSDMTSSSTYNSSTSPSKARLNYTAGSSWCAATSDSSPYLQINLGSPYIICGIATQGDHTTDQWVQSYQMLTSTDGSTFNNKYMENGQVKSFTGNFNSNTAVKNLLYDGTVSQHVRVTPTSHYGTTNCMRTELYGIKQNGSCSSRPVGLSYYSIIPDHRFTASSSYGGSYRSEFARLLTSNKAWIGKTKSDEWLEIDLGSVVYVCAVATQGAGADLGNEFAKKYKIQVSLDNVNWNYYQDINNIDKEFAGNTDRYTVVINSLTKPIRAKFIRFYPTDYNSWPSMRAEVYGISSACSSPVGLEKDVVWNIQNMTSSSHPDRTHTASHGRLYGNDSWCSSTSSNTEYIQINLGQVMTVTGIATQGDHTTDKWVKTYNISYSMNGTLWNTYKAGNNTDKILVGNSDKESVVVRWLSHPVTARHVRVTPQTWNTAICMRIELYGCNYPTRPVISGLSNQNLTAAANSYVDLVCIVQEPLIQYIKWYTGNTDITSRSSGLVRSVNGVKSTLRVNYTSANDVLDMYSCHDSVCSNAYVCRAMYKEDKTEADGVKSAGITVRLGFPSVLAAPTVANITIKSTSVTVRWIQPALNTSQSRLTSYVLQYENSTHTKTISVPAPALSHIITGLAIYTNYKIKIKAVSRVGPGGWSPVTNFKTDSALPVGLPNSFTANALTSQSIRVTWQKPGSGINGALLGYKVFYGSASNEVVDVKAGQTTCDIDNLQKWTSYRITVKCYNDKGDGPPSTEAIVRTKEDAPGKPRNFQVTVRSSTGVQLDWVLPLKRNGIIRGLRIDYTKSGGSSTIKDLPGNTTLSHVLTGMEKCTQYSFKMLAYTIKDGPYTDLTQKTTLVDAPSAPTPLTGSISKLDGPTVPQVTLTWVKPVVCGDNIGQYKVSYNHSKESTVKVQTVDKSTLTVTVPVWGGVTYWFRVRGVTNKEGPDSHTVLAIPISAPSVQPSNITFGDVNKTTFKVSWDKIPRSKSNGPIITYEVNQTLARRQRAKRSADPISEVKQMNASCCSLYLHGLLVCAEYHISIRGYTSAGAGPLSSILYLKTSVPGPPRDLNVLLTTKRDILLEWQKPGSVKEPIKSYTILFLGKKDYNASFTHRDSLTVSTTKKEVTNLYPDTRYVFWVSATTACGKSGKSQPSSSTTKVDAPPAPAVGFVSNITAEVNNITVWKSSDINGQVKAYQVIVVKVENKSSFDETKLKSYEEARKEGLHYYLAAEISDKFGKTFPPIFTLGDEKEYNGYSNEKMKVGKTYHVLQRALNQEKREYLAGPASLIAKGKLLESKGPSKENKSPGTDPTCTSSSLVAVSLAFNAAFLIFIVILVVYIRKLKKQLEETNNAVKRTTADSAQVVYENKNTTKPEEELAITSLPANEGSTYEQIDLRDTVDPSDVQAEVTRHHTTPWPADTGGGYDEPLNNKTKAKIKPNSKQQMYETVQPSAQTQNPQQNPAASSSQSPTYQSLVLENQSKPVYESLHTYGNTKVKRDGDYEV